MYGGLTYGGAHKQGMNLAKVLDKNKFNVRYFWCRPAIDKYSGFKHPLVDLMFLDDLRKNGVEVVEFKVGYRDISQKNHPWFETNFFEIFNLYKTDFIFAVRSGQAEFPVMHINKPFIEWNVFGGVDKSSNLVYSVAVSPWVQKQYLQRGGDKLKSDFCFTGINVPMSQENFRQDYKIEKNTIVLGFHQRVDDGICGEHALLAWKTAKDKTNKELAFLVLGGSENYKEIAKKLGLNVFFLPISTDSVFISKFLNTLDIYTHSGKAGESLGVAIEEAMMHKLPVVAMKGKYNGHVDVIGETTQVTENIEQYSELLLRLINDDALRSSISEKSFKRAKLLFSFDGMKQYFENLFTALYNKYCIENINNFSVVPMDIYNHLSVRMIMYRILYRFPRLLNFVLSFRNKLLIIINKSKYGNR